MNALLRFPTASLDVGQLFTLYRQPVLASLVRWGVPAADAADLCTDVFLVAMHRLPSFEGNSSVSTWLLGIAKNLASDHRRSSRTRREVLVDEVPERRELNTAEEQLHRARRAAAVHRAVEQLKPGQRAVVKGYVLEEQPMNVVALRGRVPAQTAYARLYAAQRSLRSSLSELREAA